MVPRSDQVLTVCSAILNETPLNRWIGAQPDVRFRRELSQEVKKSEGRTNTKGSVLGECTHICFQDPELFLFGSRYSSKVS